MHLLEPVLCLALACYSIFIDYLFFTKGPVQLPLKGNWMSHNVLNSVMQEYYSCPMCSQSILLSPHSPWIPQELWTGTRYVGCMNSLSLDTLLERWVCNDLRRGYQNFSIALFHSICIHLCHGVLMYAKSNILKFNCCL